MSYHVLRSELPNEAVTENGTLGGFVINLLHLSHILLAPFTKCAMFAFILFLLHASARCSPPIQRLEKYVRTLLISASGLIRSFPRLGTDGREVCPELTPKS